MRAELRRLLQVLDELEARQAGKGMDPNKIDELFRLLLLGESGVIAKYFSDIRETQDWLLLSDVAMALEEGGFFELFPRKKWISSIIRGSWDKALQDALREQSEEAAEAEPAAG